MNSDLVVVSNNPLVWEKAGASCVQVHGKALEVLYRCLNMEADGYVLHTHPISGNARLLHNPYRTVMMAKGKASMPQMKRDMATLEYFLEKMESSMGDLPPETIADYRVVDYELYLGMSDHSQRN